MKLEPHERLIVAIDIELDEGGPLLAQLKAMEMARKLAPARVPVKFNSVLRAGGGTLITAVQQTGQKVFADYKLDDGESTLARDAAFLAWYEPAFLSVKASAGVRAMRAVKARLPTTKVWAPTVHTTLTNNDCKRIYGKNVERKVLEFTEDTADAGLDGVICSGFEAPEIRKHSKFNHLDVVLCGVRLVGSSVRNDDQARVTMLDEAIRLGGDYFVVGRPITESDDPYATTMRAVELIAKMTA